MILITGGLGFVGLHTAQAFLATGKECILTQHTNDHVPEFLKDQVGKQVFIEQVNITDSEAFLRLGEKYDIEGIVHLAGGFTAGPTATAVELYKELEASMSGIANVIEAAHQWDTKRVTIASALGVYNGIMEIPWHEEQLLALTASFPLEAFKKCGEIVSSYLAARIQVECVSLRFAAMYGPMYDPARGSLVGRLVHAAVKDEHPNLEGIRGSIYAADGMDQCYVKDAARAIVLIQTADKLNHHVYNVASGIPITNQEIAEAVEKTVPAFEVELPAGHMPGGPDAVPYQDISWLRADTGFEPQFDLRASIVDYINWLRVGNER